MQARRGLSQRESRRVLTLPLGSVGRLGEDGIGDRQILNVRD